MAKNDNAWTRSLSRINLKIIFLQNYQFFMNCAKDPVKFHWLEAENLTFDPWRNFRGASFVIFQHSYECCDSFVNIQPCRHNSSSLYKATNNRKLFVLLHLKLVLCVQNILWEPRKVWQMYCVIGCFHKILSPPRIVLISSIRSHIYIFIWVVSYLWSY